METAACTMLVHVMVVYTRKPRRAAQLRVDVKAQANRTPQTEYLPMPDPKESVLGAIIMGEVVTPPT